MQQHQIFQVITAPFVAFVNMVNIPPRLERDVLITHRAAFELANPKLVHFPFTVFRYFPRVVHAFLEILFVHRVIRIGFSLDLRVPLNRRVICVQQCSDLATGVYVGEHPAALSCALEVFFPHPALTTI